MEKMQNRNILFYARFGKAWMGGVYYIRNMIFALLQNKEIMEKIHIFILTESDLQIEFSDLLNYQEVTIICKDKYAISYQLYLKVKNFYYNRVKKIKAQKDLLAVVDKYKIDVIFPMCFQDDLYKKKGIMWIPDLQHIHYPEFFPGDALKIRENDYRYLAENHVKMILSSKSVLEDYKFAYPQFTNNLFVIPFVSAIKESLINDNRVEECQQKYHISDKYFMVSNQYWKHKNHKIVFEAVHLIKEQYGVEMQVVSTGLMQNVYDDGYINELKVMINKYKLCDNILQLGLISREEQIQLMKGALAIVQPSLFEGWGTVVEDAKTLQKHIILSDIDVHKEQANADCVFFEQNNAQQLADIMLEIWQEEKPYISKANYNYKEQAAEYGKIFYKALVF